MPRLPHQSFVMPTGMVTAFAAFYLLIVGGVRLVALHSAPLGLPDLLLLLPAVLIWLLDRLLFCYRVTFGDDEVRRTGLLRATTLPWSDVSHVTFKPGGTLQGGSVSHKLILVGANGAKIVLRSSCRGFDAACALAEKALHEQRIDVGATIAAAKAKTRLVRPHWEDLPAALFLLCLTIALLLGAFFWLQATR